MGACALWRVLPAEYSIDADTSKTSDAYRDARADWQLALRERERMRVQRLCERLPPAGTRAQERERGADVLLFAGREVAHDATAVRPATPGKIGSTPSSCIA